MSKWGSSSCLKLKRDEADEDNDDEVDVNDD